MDQIAEATITEAAAEADPVPVDDAAELKKRLEAVTAEKDALAAQIVAERAKAEEDLGELSQQVMDATGQLMDEREKFALDRETMRDEFLAARANTEAQFEADHANAQTSYRESLTATGASHQLELAALREALLKERAAMVAERDAAVDALRNGLDELRMADAQMMVDRLHLPWDGLKALPAQLDDIRKQLDSKV